MPFREWRHRGMEKAKVVAVAESGMTTVSQLPASPRRRKRPSRPFRLESDLYQPVKRFLERLGYEVKGEVGGCDVLAVRPGAVHAPLVVELKLSLTLTIVLQGIDRLAVTDLVYLALPAASGGAGRSGRRAAALSPTHPQVYRLCRRLGLGLLAIHPA